MRIRRNDMVQVVTGDNAGAAAHKVIQVLDGGEKLLVEGVNRVFKHVRRGHPKSPQGGRLEMELPIHSSNVMVFCNACGKGTKTGYRFTESGLKERYCRKCGTGSGTVGQEKKR